MTFDLTVENMARLKSAIELAEIDFDTSLARIAGDKFDCRDCIAEIPDGGCTTKLICVGYRASKKEEAKR